MAMRILLLVGLCAATARADIYRWDTGEVIPGTEGITPGPGIDLSNWDSETQNLRFADFGWNSLSTGHDLTGSNFAASWLGNARFTAANLTHANLSGTDFEYADLSGSTLTDAKLTGAVVTWTDFGVLVLDEITGIAIGTGVTKEQLYSTASYGRRNLQGLGLAGSDLTAADLSGQNLTKADLSRVELTNADLTGAVVTGTDSSVEYLGFAGITEKQLYSTASYQNGDLKGVGLGRNDLRGWDFSGQDLTNANLSGSMLTSANLMAAVVTGTDFGSTNFGITRGFSKEQLYSTASYQNGNLRGIGLGRNVLMGWDFSGQDLTNADLSRSGLSNAILSGAVVIGTDFSADFEAGGILLGGITKEQLYSTTSYQRRSLQRVGLGLNDLTGWDFSGQDLTNANLEHATLTNANLSEAVVTGANLSDITGPHRGFTKAQLYSTASYKSGNLQGIQLRFSDLTGWDFAGQDLSNVDLYYANLTSADLSNANLTNANLANANLTTAELSSADLTNAFLIATLTAANLSGAKLANANLWSAIGLSSARADSATVYNQWTRFPFDFSPEAVGMTFKESPVGDFDGDDVFGIADVDLLMMRIREAIWWLDEMFDLNGDRRVATEDLQVWVKDVKHTWFGDANLDGQFNSSDLVIVLAAGEYDDPIGGNSGWAEGDWNADGEFTSADLVVALADGGYEQGPRAGVATVPEPSSRLLCGLGLVFAYLGVRRPGLQPILRHA